MNWALLGSFFPPDLTGHYLLAVVPAVVETFGVTIAAMTIAVLVALPLAVAAGIRVPGAALIGNALSLLRAVPDLTLAILCVILFGIGSGAGVMALAIYYAATLARLFINLMDTVPHAPVDALRATSASRLQVAFFGLLPLAAGDLFGYGAFAFESALRSAVIVGAVGGGGIGTELTGALAGYEFRRATTLILVIVAAIAALDWIALRLRRYPRALLPLIVLGLVAAWTYGPQMFAFHHSIEVFDSMLPPRLPHEAVLALPGLVWETIWMAASATVGAGLVGLVAAAAAARTVAPAWLVFPVRRVLELFRAVPEIVWGLVLVAVAGVGPVTGALALGLQSFGSLGRVFADTLDETPEGPRAALAGTGAGRIVQFAYAALPLATRPIAAHLLARLDWNLRMATVLGLIGAGGIGEALFQAQQLFFYDRVLAYLLVTAVLILLSDAVSGRLRARINRPSGHSSRRRPATPALAVPVPV